MDFVILPNQLYEIPPKSPFKGTSSNGQRVVLVEHPKYFNDGVNKIKIAYMRACMREYSASLKKKGINAQYVELKNYKPVRGVMYDPTDLELEREMCAQVLESPNFLLTRADLRMYKGAAYFAPFYTYAKSVLGILPGVPNLDKENRKRPKSRATEKLKRYANPAYDEGFQYAQKFKGVGDGREVNIYPINSRDAYCAFKTFVRERMRHFGDFQDYFQSDTLIMSHSCISAALNIGLISPKKILAQALNAKCAMNNKEGFVRQLIWREFMRYIYITRRDELVNSNLPKNMRVFTDDAWYTARTGVKIIDSEIKKAIKYGYAHHIVRLMVFMNFLILSGYSPHQIYEWFMRVISIDAYEWVMVANIYGMGKFSPHVVRRPYLCSTNYIARMSDYPRDDAWDKLYTKFVNSHAYAKYYARK